MHNTPDEALPQTFKAKDVKIIKDGFIKEEKEDLEELKILEDQ